MQFLQINAKNTHFLVNIPQIKILPQYPGSQDPNVLWTLVCLYLKVVVYNIINKYKRELKFGKVIEKAKLVSQRIIQI